MKPIAITTAIALISLAIANPASAKVRLFPPGSGLCTTVTRPDGVIVTTCPKFQPDQTETHAKQPEGCYPIGKKRLASTVFQPPNGDAPKTTTGGGSHGPAPKKK
jgi:hypothetical protein